MQKNLFKLLLYKDFITYQCSLDALSPVYLKRKENTKVALMQMSKETFSDVLSTLQVHLP